jgi:VanZ family protein
VTVRAVTALFAWVDRLLVAWWQVPLGLRALLPIGVMALLWWSSAQSPAPHEPSVVRSYLHNGAHVVAYAVLAVALRLVFAKEARRSGDVASFVVAAAYGIVDELHQSHVPGRVCSPSDVLTDAAGAVFGLLVLAARSAPLQAMRRLVVTGVVCLLCVSLATFGPW